MCFNGALSAKLVRIKILYNLLIIFPINIIFWSVNSTLVILCLLTAPIMALFSKNKTAPYQRWAKFWGKVLTRIASTKIEIEGLENIPANLPVIYTPNHQSNLDWMILLGVLPLPLRFIIKKELFRIPFFGKVLKKAGFFSLDREAKKRAYDTLSQVIDIARQESIVIFPEGTRTWDGKIRKFKRGALLLAFKVGSPIIPIALSGGFQIMPRYTRIIRPSIIRIKIGSPIYPEKFKKDNHENYHLATEEVGNAVATMFADLESKIDRDSTNPL
jgi:1-acyl-sn-glycerol-3-phosphate acyltransferase